MVETWKRTFTSGGECNCIGTGSRQNEDTKRSKCLQARLFCSLVVCVVQNANCNMSSENQCHYKSSCIRRQFRCKVECGPYTISHNLTKTLLARSDFQARLSPYFEMRIAYVWWRRNALRMLIKLPHSSFMSTACQKWEPTAFEVSARKMPSNTRFKIPFKVPYSGRIIFPFRSL